jgi:hypothetical protein
MDRIESPLCRLRETVSCFVVPSALCDVRALRAQIRLRQLALDDIEVIRCRLRPFVRCENKQLHRRLRSRRGNRSSLADSFHVVRSSLTS